MRRASYRHAVALVALNDDYGSPDALVLDVVSHMVTVGLMADLFGVSPLRFAFDVVRLRIREGGSREAHGQVCLTDPCELCALRREYAKAKVEP